MWRPLLLGSLIGLSLATIFIITDQIRIKNSRITTASRAATTELYLTPSPTIENPSPTVVSSENIQDSIVVSPLSTIMPTATPTPSIPTPTPTPIIELNIAEMRKKIVATSAVLGMDGKMSFFYKDLNDRGQITIDSTKAWVPASTIKAFVALEAFRQHDAGLLDLDQKITVTASNVVPTSYVIDDYPRLGVGTKVTIRQLVESMIIQSDNIAYNELIDILDRQNITNYLKALGINHTIVGQKLSLDDGQILVDSKIPGYQSITTTAEDLGIMYDLLYHNKIPESQEILDIFKKQQYQHMIPKYLPKDTIVAHKTGIWQPYNHDGGIVYKPETPYVLVIMTNIGKSTEIALLSKTLYEEINQNKTVRVSMKETKNGVIAKRPTYYMSEDQSQRAVLGISDSKVLPVIHISDLGINTDDLKNYSGVLNILINKNKKTTTPLSFIKMFFTSFFGHKDSLEENIVALKNASDKKDYANISKILDNSTSVIQTLLKSKKQLSLQEKIRTKQLIEIHFFVLKDVFNNDIGNKTLVSSVYLLSEQLSAFVQKQSINDTNIQEQSPLIGTVTTIEKNTVTLAATDGKKIRFQINDTTPIISTMTHSEQHIGSRDMILFTGYHFKDELVPLAILTDISPELIKPQTGIVTRIDPNANQMEIVNKDGQKVVISSDENTVIKSKDDTVSLEGIHVGSEILVYGINKNKEEKNNTKLHATSITVVKNGTGEYELTKK